MSVCTNRQRFVAVGAVLALAVLLAIGAGLTPVAAHAQGGCTELVVNGGFDNTNAHEGWNQYSSSNYDIVSDYYPLSSPNSAWLVAVNNEDGWIAQSVKLPADAGSLSLRYWWALVTEENPGGGFDSMKVQLLRVDGTLLATLATYDNTSSDDWLWNIAQIDLAPYAGETLQLRFYAKNDANNPTSFFVDEVSIQSCPAGGTWTPTASPTATLTVTPTLTPSPTLSITPGPSPTPTSTPRAKLYLPLVLQ